MICNKSVLLCLATLMCATELCAANRVVTLANRNVTRHVVYDDGGSEKCFAEFIAKSTEATRLYAKEYDECSAVAPLKRQELARQTEDDREQMLIGTHRICSSLQHCASMAADLDFFNCQSEAGYTNLETLADMEMRSSSVLVDLNEAYTEAEKEMLRCKIEAQRSYLNESARAYRELRSCLHS